MRNIRSRIALFFNVKTSAALDQVEDPREVLDYAYGQQQFQQRTVKRGLIEVAAARRQLERRPGQGRRRCLRRRICSVTQRLSSYFRILRIRGYQ